MAVSDKRLAVSSDQSAVPQGDDVSGELDVVLSGFEKVDVGLEQNRADGCAFFAPGDLMQYRGMVNGVQVWVERAAGPLSWRGEPMFRVAFGECPSYPPLVRREEALALLRGRLEVCDVDRA